MYLQYKSIELYYLCSKNTYVFIERGEKHDRVLFIQASYEISRI